MIALGGWAVASGIPELERRAAARERDRAVDAQPTTGKTAEPRARTPVGRLAVDFVDAPSWWREHDELPSRLATLVAESFEGRPALSSDREGLVLACERLRRSGWFEEVRQVRWSDAGRIVVDATWVVPAVVVRSEVPEVGRRDVLVDRRGHRLPYDFEIGTAGRLPLLENPAVGIAPAAGDSWGDDVEAGIALHALLAPHEWYDQVRAVDLATYHDPEGLVLKTRDCDVIWGLPPGNDSLAEPRAEHKVRYLDWLVARYGRIDAHCLGGTISLPADVVTIRPALDATASVAD